jgi:hypothetical protein
LSPLSFGQEKTAARVAVGNGELRDSDIDGVTIDVEGTFSDSELGLVIGNVETSGEVSPEITDVCDARPENPVIEMDEEPKLPRVVLGKERLEREKVVDGRLNDSVLEGDVTASVLTPPSPEVGMDRDERPRLVEGRFSDNVLCEMVPSERLPKLVLYTLRLGLETLKEVDERIGVTDPRLVSPTLVDEIVGILMDVDVKLSDVDRRLKDPELDDDALVDVLELDPAGAVTVIVVYDGM